MGSNPTAVIAALLSLARNIHLLAGPRRAYTVIVPTPGLRELGLGTISLPWSRLQGVRLLWEAAAVEVPLKVRKSAGVSGKRIVAMATTTKAPLRRRSVGV